MKVLIVGSNKVFSIENFYIRYLREKGVEVSFFPAHAIFQDYYRGILNKILYRTGLSGVYRKINKGFKDAVKRETPDIIWIFKGLEIYPESLEWAKAQNIKLANYNPDNPFIFSGRGSGNRNITASIPLYDLHFTYNLSVQHQFGKEYNMRAAFLPFGFDVDDSVYRSSLQEEEMLRTCFLGNPDEERAQFIKALAEEEIQVSVYGHHWNKFLDHPNIRIHAPVYGNDVWKVLRKYRVQLNLMRKHNTDSHNMRTFEVPAIGAIMVAPDTTEHQMFFKDREEAFFFRDVQGCAAIVKQVLALSSQHALQIRSAARKRSISAGYSYQGRAEQALKELEKLVS